MQIKKGKSCQIVMFRGKLFSTSVDMEFPALYIPRPFDNFFRIKFKLHTNILWIVKSNKNLSNQIRILQNIAGKLLSTSADMEFPELSKH